MLPRINLDMDVLRTFVTAFELGSFARAAARVGRSPSAVSSQLRKLEEQVGRALVERSGRGLVLTGAGEALLGHARRILELNDQTVASLRGSELEGEVRLGLPQDFAETWLPRVLSAFARAHPAVRIEVRTERNAHLVNHVMTGKLDLALAWSSGARGCSERVAELPLVWIGPPGWQGTGSRGQPLPLIAFEAPCIFREACTTALDRKGLAWRIAFASPSLAGLWAAAEAGLGVTLRTAFGLPKTLAVLEPGPAGLPALGSIPVHLLRAEREPSETVAQLAGILREALAQELTTPRRSRPRGAR
ncbi:LysR substrate-binding domain-containing protein [Corallococcus sp. AS-1-6]|uniref:LysR substrate-binding domain-containing protein n=1 Tax=Corallococcus sp. AS-1-6 TaxID=2874599 RepID=UPI001CC068FB|nr:LysR substrate-binding domain-containing protein [Corallococcus sp. AS-1-6]MBZ4371607.1 LysR family transcriptional regulator [Corallococcus sp. AS-1-6]